MEDPNAQQQMLLKAMVIKDKHYGEQSPEVAMTLVNLANAHTKLGDFKTQKELLERALKIQESQYLQIFLVKFGHDPHEMGKTLNNLGIAYCELIDCSMAKEVYECALEMKEQSHGKVARTLNNFGMMHNWLKDYEKSKEFYERALEMKERHYAKSHLEVARTLSVQFGADSWTPRRPEKEGRVIEEGVANFSKSLRCSQ